MAGEIEFLPEDSGDEPADLEVGSPSRSGLVWVARVAAVAVLCGALAVWVATRPSGSKQQTAAPPAASAPVSAPPVHSSSRQILTCSVGAPLDNEVTQAMQRFLPAISIHNLTAYRCVRHIGPETRVVSTAITATYRRLDIEVDLTARNRQSARQLPAIRRAPIGYDMVLLASAEAESAALNVTVSALGPTGTAAPTSRLSALADYLSLNISL